MHGAEPPGPDHEPDPDDFRAALERNPLARWWRDRAGTTGETGSRLIARDVPHALCDVRKIRMALG